MFLNVLIRRSSPQVSAEGRDFGRIRRLLVPERCLSKVLKPAETAGVVGLKIAETLPTGRGSPHGCGLRAVIYRDVTSARPDSLTASVEGTAQRRFWLAGARGYRGRRRWAAPCALPALWETWGRETAGERNIRGARKYPPTRLPQNFREPDRLHLKLAATPLSALPSSAEPNKPHTDAGEPPDTGSRCHRSCPPA